MKGLLGKIGAFLRKHWIVAAVVLIALGAVGGYVLPRTIFASGTDEADKFPAHGPAEFLYLDKARVIAYLAQLEGGEFTTETLSKKLTRGVNGKFTVPNAIEVGGSSSEEDTLARDVTPTTAANYFALLGDLDGMHEGLATLGLGQFENRLHGLTEGQFVRFESHSLQAPTYLNPYLALRQKTTFTTIFPPAIRATEEKEKVMLRRQRIRASHFRDRLGKQPRVVFAIQSLYRFNGEHSKRIPDALKPLEQVRCHRTAVADNRQRKSSTERKHRQRLASEQLAPKQTKRERREQQRVRYLMPLDARLLTKERSLLKFGGGTFTVVGKVVRIFPEAGDDQKPAYIDSQTRETWEQPLLHAPKKLICSTNSGCRHKSDRHPGKQHRAITELATREARCQDLAALKDQTEIPVRGAVILPIAIYK